MFSFPELIEMSYTVTLHKIHACFGFKELLHLNTKRTWNICHFSYQKTRHTFKRCLVVRFVNSDREPTPRYRAAAVTIWRYTRFFLQGASNTGFPPRKVAPNSELPLRELASRWLSHSHHLSPLLFNLLREVSSVPWGLPHSRFSILGISLRNRLAPGYEFSFNTF